MTDIVTLILSLFFFALGASRGFICSLLVPFSIIVSTFISVIYYQITKDILISLLIGLIGPVLLHLLLKFLLKTFTKTFNAEIRPSFLSRLGGAFLTLAWGWIFIIFTIILLAVMPPWGKTMKFIHDDVTS